MNVRRRYLTTAFDSNVDRQADYYEYETSGGLKLAIAFRREVDSIVDFYTEHPEIGSLIVGADDVLRRVQVKKFKQPIYYLLQYDEERMIFFHLRGQQQRPLELDQIIAMTYEAQDEAEAAEQQGQPLQVAPTYLLAYSIPVTRTSRGCST